MNDPTNWRQHWLPKYALSEIPIIGSFFKYESKTEALYDAVKCTAMLVGGTAAMVEEDATMQDAATMAAEMAMGMTVAKIGYVGLYKAGEMLYKYVSNKYAALSEIAAPSTELAMQETTPFASHEPTPT